MAVVLLEKSKEVTGALSEEINVDIKKDVVLTEDIDLGIQQVVLPEDY